MTYPSDEVEDRVIARALDATESDPSIPDQRIPDPRTDEADMDVAAIAEYHRVLAHLPFQEIAPPAELEDRVVAAALERRPATVRSIDRARHGRRRAAVRWAALGGAVAAAAGVIAFMVATGDSTGVQGGDMVLANAAETPQTEILDEPGTREAELTTTDERAMDVGQVALATSGEGVIYDLELMAPDPGTVIVVWLVTEDQLVPIGRFETAEQAATFTVEGDADSVTAVWLSIEDADEQRPEDPTPFASATF